MIGYAGILWVLLASTSYELTPRIHFVAAYSTLQTSGWKSDDVSLGIPPAWPRQGLDAIGYLQDSYFNLYLVCSRTLFCFLPLLFGSLYCISCILDSLESCCISFLLLLWIIMICCNVTTQLRTWNRVLCGFGRERRNSHSARSRGVTFIKYFSYHASYSKIN